MRSTSCSTMAWLVSWGQSAQKLLLEEAHLNLLETRLHWESHRPRGGTVFEDSSTAACGPPSQATDSSSSAEDRWSHSSCIGASSEGESACAEGSSGDNSKNARTPPPKSF